VLKNTYSLFPRWVVDKKIFADEKQLPLTVLDKISYDTYKPKYNDGAEKIRTVSVKESNYFNNL
jgi:hypothetical protein